MTASRIACISRIIHEVEELAACAYLGHKVGVSLRVSLRVSVWERMWVKVWVTMRVRVVGED